MIAYVMEKMPQNCRKCHVATYSCPTQGPCDAFIRPADCPLVEVQSREGARIHAELYANATGVAHNRVNAGEITRLEYSKAIDRLTNELLCNLGFKEQP